MSDSLVSRLLAHASGRPGDAAIVDARQTVTYGELARRLLNAAARLDALGVRAGDMVALSFGESREQVVDFVSALYAVGHLGAAVLPLYQDVPQGGRRGLVSAFGARWVISERNESLGAPTLALGDVCDKSHTPGAHPPRGDTPDQLFYLQFSSGTSGNPKALPFTHAQFFMSATANVAAHGWRPGDRLIPAVPAPSKVGLRYLLRVLFAGATCVNVPFPDTRQALTRAAAAFGINAASGSPWQLRRLLASPAASVPMPPPLRFLSAIGAVITAEEVRAIRAAITPNLHVSYGSTESGLIATLRPQDDPADGYTPVAGLEAEVVDPSGVRLPRDAEGILRLRAPWIPPAYAGNPAETAKRFRDGWFYPGDTVRMDAAGRLHVRGRSDTAINFGGVKVIPEEVEAALLTHPGVSDAVVTGVPHVMAGEIPVAFVVISPPTTLEALKLFCEVNLDANSIPAGIFSLEKMPRSPDGKVARALLKEHARSLAHMFHSTKP
jgi:long-chain acyl-CoA synthetase